MIDYTELNERFPSEKDCLDFLASLRWSDGYSCPRCKSKETWILNKDTSDNKFETIKYKCRKCGYQTSITAGTLFHKTHITIQQWFQAIWYVSIKKNKATIRELKTEIGIASNQTALNIMNKIKSVMFINDENIVNALLEGNIEICIDKDNLILTAVEAKNHQIGHIRIYRLPKYDKESFNQFILSNIKKGSNIKREGGHWKLGQEMERVGYSFKVIEPEIYPARYANDVYRKFKKYYSQKKKENPEMKLTEIIDEYMWIINSFTYDLSFDKIVLNAVTCEPRENLLKR